jgi:DNA repair exonuclease SbcCD ATPase subunit
MAIDKTININVNSKDAVQDITLLNSILEEQEQITIELQREQQKLEQQLRDTPKNSLAAQKELTTELNHVKDSIKDQNLSVKQLKVQQKSLGKGTNDLTNDLVSNGGAMGILNNLTGGLAQQFKDSYEAISLSSKGLSGFKRAMLATGIGVLVVGVGLLVANFDKIKDFLSGITAESKAAREALEKEAEALNQAIAKQTTEIQTVARAYESGALKGENLKNVVNDLNEKYEDANLELDENNELTADSLAFIDSQIKSIKVQAKNKAILTNIEALYSDELQAQTLIGQQNNKFMVERAKLTELLIKLDSVGEFDSTRKNSLNKQIAASERRQKSIANEIVSLTNQRAEIQDTIDKETRRLDFTEFAKPRKRSKSSSKDSGKSAEDIAKEEAIKEADRLKKLEDLKNKIRDAEANKEDEARALELKKIQEHNVKLLKEAKDNDLLTQELKDSLNEKLAAKQAEFDAIDKARKEKIKAENRALEDEVFLELEEEANKKIELENKVKDAKVGIAKNTLSLISEVAGEGSNIGKGVALAQATISGIEGVQNAYTTAQKSPVTAVFPAYPIIQAGLAGAFSAMQLKKIASTNPSKGSASGGGASVGGGGASQPPAFNIVGASDTNQLADAIGAQEQQPVQAYVVANDVTTAQSLQNNIVEGATIG